MRFERIEINTRSTKEMLAGIWLLIAHAFFLFIIETAIKANNINLPTYLVILENIWGIIGELGIVFLFVIKAKKVKENDTNI